MKATPIDRISEDRAAQEAEVSRRVDELASLSAHLSAATARFVELTGKRAAIGGLADIERIVAGTAGTQVQAGAD